MHSSYGKLALAISINTVVMFLVMYVMIDTLAHFYVNVNQIYMTVLMVAPMVLVMLLVMRSMFERRALNLGIAAVAIVVIAVSYGFIRTQTTVGNEQFLRSMIPHHSGAILMCEEAPVTDPRIVSLCERIIESQTEEIAEMEEILAGY